MKKTKCHACGKSLLSLKQIHAKGLQGDNWDCSRWHYRCWTEMQYQYNLELITVGMAKLTLQDTTKSGPAASTTSFSWLLLLLPLLFLSQLLFLLVLL